MYKTVAYGCRAISQHAASTFTDFISVKMSVFCDVKKTKQR